MSTEAAIEAKTGYRFKDGGLLRQSLTHPSLAGEPNNQRMEFLGDAVLGMVIAQLLYELYPTEAEGSLARRRASLICGESLAEVARAIGLGPMLRMGTSEKQIKGEENGSNLEDALEALICAIYLDGGMEAAERFVLAHWTEKAKKAAGPVKDAKSALQEWAQGRGLAAPAYSTLEQTGAAHAPEFTVEVSVTGHEPARAKAASKRAAEQLAAAELLGRLG